MSFSQNWNLESIFTNGSDSKDFEVFLNALNEEIFQIHQHLTPQSLKVSLRQFQDFNERFEQADSFVSCLLVQNIQDKKAELLQNQIGECHARLLKLSNAIDDQLAQLSEPSFLDLLKDVEFAPIVFSLQERRDRQKEKLSLPLERLIADLSIDGYHSWSNLYGTYLSEEIIPVKNKEEIEHLSWGQAYNRLSDSNRQIRQEVFYSSNKLWDAHKSVYTSVLNRIGGFRLKVYEHRQWHFLKEPLDINRLTESSLNAMWKTIEENKGIFVECLNRKAQLLGLKKLSWYDLEAPLGNENHSYTFMPYEEGAQFIIEQFNRFSPQMGSFAQKALINGWIEAEDRKGKRPGGFCTGLPLLKESRIFMTYSGTNESLFTLAHELGHAFHNHIIYNLPEMARHFPTNLAETASTFAEMIVSEAAYEQAMNPNERLQLLNAKLQRSIVFMFNIHARFLFETRFYEERQKGILSTQRLCELMEASQKEAYCGVLEEYHPYFWASKMHFNSTGTPFYNFPYTFGYLFSTAVYHQAKLSTNFENTYIALLSDTGRMSSEDLAKKHLKADLKEKSFWQNILNVLKRDAEAFLSLTSDI